MEIPLVVRGPPLASLIDLSRLLTAGLLVRQLGLVLQPSPELLGLVGHAHLRLLLRALVLGLPATTELLCLLGNPLPGLDLGVLVLGFPTTAQCIRRFAPPCARLVQSLRLLFVPAPPPGLELGLTSLPPLALCLLVVLRPPLAKLGELPL